MIGDGDLPLDPLDDLTGPGQDLQPVELDVLGGPAGAVIVGTAAKKAKERENAAAMVGKACADCKDDPCEELAKGKEGSKYKGGSHGNMSKPPGDKKDSHHMPAKNISPLSWDDGPAIQMHPDDHRATHSYGRTHMDRPGRPGDPRLKAQKWDIDNGRFRRAQELDIIEVRTKFGTKYDEAIEQMEAYTECLEQQGRI